MINKILNICFIVFFISACEKGQKNTITLTSPNNEYEFSLRIDDSLEAPLYSLYYNNESIIADSKLGFELGKDTITAASYKILDVTEIERNAVDSAWKPVYGERNSYPETYNESVIQFTDEYKTIFNLRVRAYNEGLAFRYEFDNGTTDAIGIHKELTEFLLPNESFAWVSTMAQGKIVKKPVNLIQNAVERPLLVELKDSTFLAIGEAALVDYARMKFKVDAAKRNSLVVDLSSRVLGGANLITPWRFVMAAKKPGQLLENNYLLLNLNEPNKISNTNWIKPGKIIRESTLTTKGGYACVDFAEKHNLQFIEFDAGWYGNEYDDASDATTVTVDPNRSNGPLDLLNIIEYAKSKNIGVILYVNRRSLETQLDEVLPLLSSWGVSGVKYGFVNVGSQYWTSWLHDAVRKAADHKLMVDIHDEYRPTGYSRTYPNLMTQEGIRGDEESPKNTMVLNTIFTRMIAGAGDQTNCYFAPRVTEVMGSHVSQMAKAVCIYSPWQFLYWYDRPEGSVASEEGAGGVKEFIQEVPELAFYDALPTVWDDTKIIDGYPGKFAVIARKKDTSWFVGVLNGDEDRQIDLPLSFLQDGKSYKAIIYEDDESLNTLTNVSIRHENLNRNNKLSFNINKSNGVAIHIIQE